MIRVERLLRITRRLAEPAENAATSVEQRSSLLLVLTDELGNRGLGEAAPLPGYSRDDLEGAARALLSLRDDGSFAPFASGDVVSHLDAAVPPALSGSARHALETALIDVWSRGASVPAFAWFGNAVASPRELAALLPSDARESAVARDAYAAGFRHFKLKLGVGRTLAQDVTRLARLRAELGSEARLRADANRVPSHAEFAPFVSQLQALDLEWIEEPAHDFHTGAPLDLPVALDESLLDRPDLAAARERGARYVVLKPSLLGGISRCFALAKAARAAGLVPVASHQFEGVVGFQSAALLALALGPGRPADGLGPHVGLGRDQRAPALALAANTLTPWREPGLGVTLDDACADARVQVLA